MSDREKLIELIRDGSACPDDASTFDNERCASCRYCADVDCDFLRIADYLLANSVTVQKHGRWEKAKYIEAPVYVCSECGNREPLPRKFCPECGVMTEKEERA